MAVQAPGIPLPLAGALRATREDSHREHQAQGRTGNGNSILFSEAVPTSPLLSLPFELRRMILEHVFLMSSTFPPPRKSPPPARLGGLIGRQYEVSRPGWKSLQQTGEVLRALLLCRKLYEEARLIPLQVNVIDCPGIMGSNLIATEQFLKALQPFQRNAIRSMKLQLLGSVTETWSLRSVLRALAHISNSPGRSDLRELTVVITSRDLLLAGADSRVGLLHVLAVPLASGACSRSSNSSGHIASWITEGLALLRALRRLKIVIEISASVGSQLDADIKDSFTDFVRSVVSWIEVDIQWTVRDSIISIDDDSWADFVGHGDPVAV